MHPTAPPVTTSLDPPEVIFVTTTRVACDGGGGALGHPIVYMEMGDSAYVECGYCDRRFVLRGPGDTESEAAGAGMHAPEDH